MPSIPEGLAAALADRYRLERELGVGGMATVYLAEDLKHHRPVAIKVLRPELADAIAAEAKVPRYTAPTGEWMYGEGAGRHREGGEGVRHLHREPARHLIR